MARVNPIQVQKFLGGIDYPISKQDLVKHAQDEGADRNVCEALQPMSADSFNSPNAVSEALGTIE